MEKYIAILRGINVSGSKMIKMDDLKLSMSELNFKNIETYIQSGNLVFKYTKTNQHDLAKKIKYKIQKDFGFQVPVIVKNSQELNFLIAHNSFINERNEPVDKLHVTFLAEEPPVGWREKLAGIDANSDEFIILKDVIYIFCLNGYGRTKLNNNYFEAKLKISATTRNWKTVIKLAEMINAES